MFAADARKHTPGKNAEKENFSMRILVCDDDAAFAGQLAEKMEHIRNLQSTRLYLRDGTELPVSSHTASAVRKIYTQWRSAKKWVIG